MSSVEPSQESAQVQWELGGGQDGFMEEVMFESGNIIYQEE